eukprot:gene6791-9304_t
MDRLTKSLDELIKEKYDANKANKKAKFGGIKNTKKTSKPQRAAPYTVPNVQKSIQPVASGRNVQQFVNIKQPQHQQQQHHVKQPTQTSDSVFSRLAPPTNVVVYFSNLKNTVEKADIDELCSEFSTAKTVELKFDRFEKGTAKVVFANKVEATNCVSKYNGLCLDGELMVVKQIEEISNKPSFGANEVRNNSSQSSNVSAKAGLFGTALTEDFQPSFSITMKSIQPISKNHNNGSGNQKSNKVKQPRKSNNKSNDVDLDDDLANYFQER